MSESEILFDVKDGLGVITLNRPKALNALTHGMILELEKVLPGWEKDPAIKAVVLRGAGDRAFCAGGDVIGLYREMQRQSRRARCAATSSATNISSTAASIASPSRGSR